MWHNIINVIPRVTIQSLIQSTLIYKVTNKSSGTAQDKYCVQDTHVDVPEVQKQNKKTMRKLIVTFWFHEISKINFQAKPLFLLKTMEYSLKHISSKICNYQWGKLMDSRYVWKNKSLKLVCSNEDRVGYGFIQNFGIRILAGSDFSNM